MWSSFHQAKLATWLMASSSSKAPSASPESCERAASMVASRSSLGGGGGLLEVVGLVHRQEVADLAERGRRVLDPRRDVHVGDALGAPAVDLQEVVELREPDRRVAAGLGQAVADLLGLGVEQVGDAEPAGLGHQVPHRAVGLHDLRVTALEELRHVAGVDAVGGAQSVELEVDPEQRVHQLEVDLPRPPVERAGVGEELADVGQRLAVEVVALEVLEAELELPLALLPDGVEVLEELRHVPLDAGGPEADLPRGRRGDLGLVGERPTHPLASPLPGGSGSQCAAVCVPHDEQSVM